MTRTAHYVSSSHWDREWYEPLQGFRMRLVSMLDEVFDRLASDPTFRFAMDGQVIPVADYLEVRPEKMEIVRRYARDGRFKVGPWYVLPDEWLVSGESLVRNLQLGIEEAGRYGAPSSRAGIVCDQFGHISQLPQLFDQLGIEGAFAWRGVTERDYPGHFLWRSPDGTTLPTFKFCGVGGYSSIDFRVREAIESDKTAGVPEMTEKLVAYARLEAARSSVSPILLFDGGDHMEIEPRMSEVIAAANTRLAADGIRIVHSDLDAYQAAMIKEKAQISRTIVGELRESGREPHEEDHQWLIPGVYSSRIHLKQRNAACEDELCLWAEPFSTFASDALGAEYPSGYLKLAWKHLLENHPHDSICGCSIDQVHQDMIYRFDQSIGISSRLTERAMRAITRATGATTSSKDGITLGVFNATADAVDEPVDLEIPLPDGWPAKFQEFFGFEEKFAFKLRGPDGAEIPYQLVGHRRDVKGFYRPRYKFPVARKRHVVNVTARVQIPAFGYTTLTVEPAEGPTRYLASMANSHRSIENESLHLSVNPNGTLRIHDKRTGATFDQLLTFEQRADIGDGWYHGLAVNDQIFTSAASHADVALVADGIGKATLRISVTMNVPAAFDFTAMTRTEEKAALRITSDVTLRQGSDHVEVTTTVENNVLDHRLRVLMPTGLSGDTYLCDSAFDVVERAVALAADNAIRKELDVETRPQVTWTSFGDGKAGLAVISRGLPESAVCDTADRPIALTLLRSFRRAVFSNDNMGGQVQGTHVFRYDILPFSGAAPVKRLFLLGQRVNGVLRQIAMTNQEQTIDAPPQRLPRAHSFLRVQGDAVVTSIQHQAGDRLVRLFNPHAHATSAKLSPAKAARSITLDARDDSRSSVKHRSDVVEIELPAKRIATVALTPLNPNAA